MVILN